MYVMFNVNAKRSSIVLFLCSVCAMISVMDSVRYDGGGVRSDYVEYQNARPYSKAGQQQPTVFTFPQDKEYYDRTRFEVTTRRPTFSDEPVVPPEVPCCGNDHQQIPLDLIIRLNGVQNVSDLWEFVNTESPVEDAEPPVYAIANRFGGDTDVERSAAMIPKPANCMPELTTVPLVSEEATSTGVFYFPSCTRVKRCGGCCSHSLLSCQPVQTEQLSFQIIKSEFNGGSKLSYSGKEIVLVEQHTKCKCDCIVKAEHCNQFQDYRKNECRCVCTNFDDEEKCIQENSTKLWDPHSCVCRCRESLECTSGSFFDQSTCQCAQIPSRNLDPGADRRRYKVKPIPIVPHEEEKYEV